MKYFANILVLLSLGIWIGALMFFGAGVASVLFRDGVLPNRTMAGAVNSIILHRLGIIEVVCGVALLFGALYFAFKQGSWMNWVVLGLAVGMLATSVYYSSILFPRVDRMRAEIGSFDNVSSEKATLRGEFDSLHNQYSGLAKGVLMAAVIAFVLHSTAMLRVAKLRDEEVVGTTMPSASIAATTPMTLEPSTSVSVSQGPRIHPTQERPREAA